MTESIEEELFFTAIKYADMRLQGLPQTKSGVIRKAKKECWKRRKRQGCGGGWEYSVESLPTEARMAYFERSLDAAKKDTDEKSAKKDIVHLTSRQREIADKYLGIVMEWLHINPDVPPRKRMEFKRNLSKKHGIHYNTLDSLVKAYQRGGYHALVPNYNNGGQKKS